MRSLNQTKKIIYGLVIVLLFSAMYPYTQWLNRVKVEKDLGEAAIGQIDTGSFMMKLFLLGGFRGIVANYLWIQAEDYKKNHDWDRLKATVDLITKLQPHFLSIWTFQGWNLAYNVSVEWDAPEDKYEWIKQGIKFVQKGVENNQRSPDLIWDTAWFYYHKLGFSDESIILRRLFRDDDDEAFKTYRDPESGLEVVRGDNFQLGYGWFSRAVRLVDEGGARLGGGTAENIQYIDPTPQRKGRADDIAFRSMPSHAQTHYAAALEKMSMAGIEATFGEVAKNEWARALNEWVKFGSHVFMSHNEVLRDGKLVRDEVRLDDATNRERYSTLTENAQYWTDRWADQMNYRYWKERCQAEMTSEGVAARQLFYEGTKAYKTGDFTLAAGKFRDGLTIWNENLKNFPTYREDDLNRKDTGLVVKRYVRVLRQLGEPVPDTLPFKDLLAAAEADNTVDPFDAIEMLGVGAGEVSTTPPPTSGRSSGQPAADAVPKAGQ
ncbi:hypothetical protein [Planctomyces sp. SH-PL62]|uniref:hypothetical protein n=1 Tax=Planctomyces sp. SH-PL62 TaxID=1636152 RepID=UPI00078D017F|nr:hypothetical protein [Planctomyces sp. SH-PL62]AMV39930.1 hypothetical protein VT85_21030 [Planctomyces sp. SH-PL62]